MTNQIRMTKPEITGGFVIGASTFLRPSSFVLRYLCRRSPNPQSAYAPIGINVQPDMRAIVDGGNFLLEEMLPVGLQLGFWKNLAPPDFSASKLIGRSVGCDASVDRAHVGIVSLEVIGIDFNLPDRTRPPKLQNNPIESGTAPAFCFPAVAHIFGATRHDQIIH